MAISKQEKCHERKHGTRAPRPPLPGQCQWSGDTAVGYENYDRTHTSSAPPASAELRVSADSAFCGNPERINPEQLVVMAASSCQLLSFLALAARVRVQVLEYDDRFEAEMPENDKPVRLTRITLRPRVVVGPGDKKERILKLAEMAYKRCYITDSLITEVTVEPEEVKVRVTETTD